jgi:hypothetical protein
MDDDTVCPRLENFFFIYQANLIVATASSVSATKHIHTTTDFGFLFLLLFFFLFFYCSSTAATTAAAAYEKSAENTV